MSQLTPKAQRLSLREILYDVDDNEVFNAHIREYILEPMRTNNTDNEKYQKESFELIERCLASSFRASKQYACLFFLILNTNYRKEVKKLEANPTKFDLMRVIITDKIDTTISGLDPTTGAHYKRSKHSNEADDKSKQSISHAIDLIRIDYNKL